MVRKRLYRAFLLRWEYQERQNLSNTKSRETLDFRHPEPNPASRGPARPAANPGERHLPGTCGSVIPTCFWYLPFLSLYETRQSSSLSKNSTCAMPSLA